MNKEKYHLKRTQHPFIITTQQTRNKISSLTHLMIFIKVIKLTSSLMVKPEIFSFLLTNAMYIQHRLGFLISIFPDKTKEIKGIKL